MGGGGGGEEEGEDGVVGGGGIIRADIEVKHKRTHEQTGVHTDKQADII